MDLPLSLMTALESGNCVLFVGAGVGYHARTGQGQPAPDARVLAAHLAEYYSIDAGSEPDLAKVAQVVQVRRGRAEMIARIEPLLADLEPDEHLRWLFTLTWKAIFTTNYDNLIERCYEVNPNPTQTPVVMATNSQATTFDPRFQVPIFHLHGSLHSEAAKDAILITEDDYATYRERRRMLFEQFKYAYATTPILYVGYSNTDPNWRIVTNELRAEFLPKTPPQAFRLAPATNPLDREILRSQGIETLDGALADLHKSVTTTLGDIRVEPHTLAALKNDVPPELQPLFEIMPAAVVRLLNSWWYVNQADFTTEPNTSAFLKGDPPNWALVAQGINFERDLEKPFVDLMFNFATDPQARSQSHIILGPAGYGMTTLLMAIAAWAAKNRAGTVLFLRPGAEPLEADAEFVVSNLKGPVFLIVDNAADHVARLASLWSDARESRNTVFLLLGERLNEWRQRRSALRLVEHQLESLSDDEIWRLLTCLERAGSLGKLAEVKEDIRFARVQVRNQKELLVTMREVTEGRAFDAIVEDEFRSIATEEGKDLYALVSAFTRVRALARDSLIAEALNIAIGDLYQIAGDSVEGIVHFDLFDEARGLYAARARHHVIADIVWQRCVDPVRREQLTMSAMQALNLSYGIDAKAFEAFTRDDETVESLRSLESKSRFFEQASRKDPDNPYVRQHYARMLLRADLPDLALSQIDRAIDMSPKTRVLHHTRGLVLKHIALERSAPEMARRRLAQSEAAFRLALKLAPRDEYSYQTLAELFLGWAKKSASMDESVTYVSKAEETVREGMSQVRHREGLYIVSSQIEEFLRHTPARIAALRKALSEAPQSAVARYLLGTVFRHQGNYSEAEEVLREGIKLYPEDPRLTVAYALTLHEWGKGYPGALAVLELAVGPGLRDPLFVAVYGGMLTLNGQLKEAQSVWSRSEGLNLTLQELNRVVFYPCDKGSALRLDGWVATIGPGYAFIRVNGITDFYCHRSKYQGLVMRRDESVRIRPGFAARGPVVVEIEARS